jgi:hypothetical protein
MTVKGPYEKPHYYMGLAADTKPLTAAIGDEFFVTDTKIWYIFNGTAWVQKPGGTAGFWNSVSSVVDDATVTLPTVTANYSMHGYIRVSSSGAIDESAEFEADSTGNATIIRGTTNVVTNANTDAKFCVGTAGSQNPLIVKNRLGSTKVVMISVSYN